MIIYNINMVVLLFVILVQFNLYSQGAKNTRSNQDPYSAALNLYQSEDFMGVLRELNFILERDPADLSAKTLKAKTLYKLGRLEESYHLFTTLELNNLDIETSYEYGQTHYHQKNYPQCLSAFNRVPLSGHVLSDLANYFAGICAIRIGEYELAETKFENAMVLPSNLAQRRQTYLAQLQKIIATRNQQPKNNRRIQQPSKLPQIQIAAPVKQDKSAKTLRRIEPKKRPPYKHQGFETIKKQADFGAKYNEQRLEFGGFSESDHDHKIGYFEYKNGIVQYYRKNNDPRRYALGLQIDSILESRSTSGFERKNIVSESHADGFKTTEQPFPKGSSINLFIKAKPFFELPLPYDSWLAISAYYDRLLIELKGGFGGGNHGAYIDLAKRVGAFYYGWRTGLDFSRDKDHKTAFKQLSNRATLAYYFLSQLSLRLRLKHDSYNYSSKVIEGPDSLTSLGLMVEQIFPLGVTLSGEILANLKQNYSFQSTEVGSLSANSNGLNLDLKLEASPVSFFKFFVNSNQNYDSWKVKIPNGSKQNQELFEQNVPNIIRTLELGISINLFF